MPVHMQLEVVVRVLTSHAYFLELHTLHKEQTITCCDNYVTHTINF